MGPEIRSDEIYRMLNNVHKFVQVCYVCNRIINFANSENRHKYRPVTLKTACTKSNGSSLFAIYICIAPLSNDAASTDLQ